MIESAGRGEEERSSAATGASTAPDRRRPAGSLRGLVAADGGRLRLAVAAGRMDTRRALARWRHGGRREVAGWAAGALALGLLLLVATLAVADATAPARTLVLPTFADPRAGVLDALRIAGDNLLVALLNCLICVASYLALRSVPDQARRAEGPDRFVRALVRPLVLVALAAVTLLSLSLQAWRAGHALAGAAPALGLSHLGLLARLGLHAVPELTGVFLPLAACLALLRAGRHRDLLAGALVAAALALPLVGVAACCEVWVTRALL